MRRAWGLGLACTPFASYSGRATSIIASSGYALKLFATAWHATRQNRQTNPLVFLNGSRHLANNFTGGGWAPKEYLLPRRHLQWSKGVTHHVQEDCYRNDRGRGGAVHSELHPPRQLCQDRHPQGQIGRQGPNEAGIRAGH